MARAPFTEDADPLGPPGPYDPEEGAEEPPWFLPPADTATDAAAPPMPWGPPAPRRGAGGDLAAWQAAEAAQAAPLAQAATALGALDERVRVASPGLRARLVLREAADLCWHLGARVTVERLALHLADRLTGAAAAGEAVDLAALATRRLGSGGPLDPASLADFLGLPTTAPLPPPCVAWRDTLAESAGLHPLTRAARAWHAWRREGLSGDGPPVEGALAAARIGAETLRPGGLGFVPVALAGPGALRPQGDVAARLAAWIAGVERAALAGLMEADRLATWERDAAARTGDLSGRTPPRLIAALSDQPVASVPTLAAGTGASRAAVQRNMAVFETRGLVAELTGQSRFRYWRIAFRDRRRGG